MATSIKGVSSKTPTIRRILKEAEELSKTPTPDITAGPTESDLFSWHFTIRGPPSSPYENGLYHGRIDLSATYPLRPPSFRFLTPSGRFEVNREICLSISGHHEETWMPAWGVRTALLALRSFMMQEAEGQVGGLACGENERKQMAAASKDWTCGTCARSNGEIMKEADQAFAAAGQKSDELVPEELKLGYREDTQPAAQQDGHAQAGPSIASKSAPASSAHLPLGHDTDAELAEGFVPTRPASHSPKRQTYMSPNQLEPIDFPSPNLPVALPGQSIPTPTSQRVPDFQADAYPPYMDDPVRGAEQRRRHFNANHGSQTVGDGNAQMAQQVREHLQQNNVPVWIDRAIAALGLLLVCLVLKMIFK